MSRLNNTARQRFEDKCVPVTESGCLLWIGAISDTGYGNFWDGEKKVLVHRYNYEFFNGRIPEGLVIDHKCRVRCCVNTNHLEVVTQKENIRRGIGICPISAVNRAKTHCPKGHKYSGENLYKTNSGSRVCRTCQSSSNRKSYLKKKEKRDMRVVGLKP